MSTEVSAIRLVWEMITVNEITYDEALAILGESIRVMVTCNEEQFKELVSKTDLKPLTDEQLKEFRWSV